MKRSHDTMSSQPMPPATTANSNSNSSVALAPPVPPLPPPLPLVTTKPQTVVQTKRFVKSLLEDFYRRQPHHPMFGEMEAGLVRAPINKWRDYINAYLNKQFSTHMLPDNCWIIDTPQIKINNGSKNTKSVQYTRLFAFLLYPTDDNWTALCKGGVNEPFSHLCNRGSLAGGRSCTNGIWHGSITTRAENEDHKRCANGALALCPGHGDRRVKCIFTNVLGEPAPCRMTPTHVPQCNCNPRCY